MSEQPRTLAPGNGQGRRSFGTPRPRPCRKWMMGENTAWELVKNPNVFSAVPKVQAKKNTASKFCSLQYSTSYGIYNTWWISWWISWGYAEKPQDDGPKCLIFWTHHQSLSLPFFGKDNCATPNGDITNVNVYNIYNIYIYNIYIIYI